MLLVITLLTPVEMMGQEDSIGTKKSQIPPSTLKLEELKHSKDSTGLIKDILQLFKFRENRNRKEKERLYYNLKEFTIDAPKLVIDSSTTRKIIEQLQEVSKELDSIKKKDSIRHFTDVLPELEIDYDEEEIAQKKAKQKAQINAEVISHEEEKRIVYSKTDSIFGLLEAITHGHRSKLLIERDVRFDSIDVGDSIYYFKKCLKPIPETASIIGWHNALKKDNSENYNFNYLSAINYFGFELEEDGSTKWPEYLGGEQKPKIIERAQAYGNDIFLTIYNKNRYEIANFLRNTSAQETLFNELKSLKRQQVINGVNIYFQEVSLFQKEEFVLFVQKLHQQLETVGMQADMHEKRPFKLAITLPAIINEKSVANAQAYDFGALDSLVDQYWILTDRLVDLRKPVPQALGPLYKSRANGGTIVSTMDYYLNNGIVKEKLIMTVSYSGVAWDITKDGNLIGMKGKEMTYGEILKNYKYDVDANKLFAIERFDDKQATAYISTIERDQNLNRRYKEIWYDDPRSLFEKYKWAKEKGIGGVSIRELNNDNGDSKFGEEYLRLWKVLGASLVQMPLLFL